MELNQRFLQKLQDSLELNDRDASAFSRCLTEGNASRPAILHLVARGDMSSPTSPFFDFVTFEDCRSDRGKSAAHDNGEIYCLDHSSIFSLAPLKEIEKASTVLDVCASPGGKSLLAWRFLSPQFFVSNEIVRKRVKILISNLKRCHIRDAAVSSLDSAVLAEKFRDTFHLVLVDAPCSGQSLLAKGDLSPGCLNPAVIKKNAGRQKRIIANAVQCLRPGGYALYSTCTFSAAENEKIVEWVLKKFPHMQALPVECLSEYRSTFTENPCYRLYPHQGLGAGAFTALLKDGRTSSVLSGVNLREMKYAWRCDVEPGSGNITSS